MAFLARAMAVSALSAHRQSTWARLFFHRSKDSRMKKTLVALAASCAVTAVFAQSSAPAAAAPASSATVQSAASAPAGSRREARVEERIAQLHSSLKITSAQEAQWA